MESYLEFSTTLNDLVIDYLKRQPVNERVQLLQNIYMVQEVENPVDTNKLTLEKVFFRYNLCVPHQDDHSRGAGSQQQEPTNVACPLHSNHDLLTELPHTVMTKVLNFLPINAVYPLRSLNQHWNQVASEYLYDRQHSALRFYRQARCSKFLNIFSNRMDYTPFPFSSADIYVDRVDCFSFLPMIGKQIQKLSVKFDTQFVLSYALLSILQQVPFLVNLSVAGTLRTGPVFKNDNILLENLSSLQFTPSLSLPLSPTNSNIHFLQWNTLWEILKVCPNLQRLSFSITLRFESLAEFYQFLDHASMIKTVAIRKFSILSTVSTHAPEWVWCVGETKTQSLTLDGITADTIPYVEIILATLSSSIRKLVLKFNSGRISLPRMEVLESIHITDYHDRNNLPRINPSCVPALHTVTVQGNDGSESYFQNDVYITVNTLSVIWETCGGHHYQHHFPRHSSFPNVLTLQFTGVLTQADVQHIATNWKAVRNLHLINRPSPSRSSLLVRTTTTAGDPHLQQKWILDDLPGLQNLVLEVDSDGVERITKHLIDFTLAREMNPLDSLKVVLPTTNKTAIWTPIALFFQSLDETKWHKKMQFKFKFNSS